ncbi:MAG: GNAT family N-acetyltransferase [Candidatus Eremiobacteraeota bacterium]|nr:GNAT family N-acetyltransferase [Candidatus Eremiobacteraeota bacterium]
MADASKIRIVRAGLERLDDVEPLWRALRDHHADIAATLVPVRSAEESWRRRRAEYTEWLSDSSATILFAEEDAPVGYLMLHMMPGPPSWAIGDRIAEVETLSILPAARDHGVGKLLMAAARREARERGATTLSVALLHTNEGARRFYEREGFHSFYLTMLASIAQE